VSIAADPDIAFSPVPNATFTYAIAEYGYSGWTRLHKAPSIVVSSQLQALGVMQDTSDAVRVETAAYLDGLGRTRETQVPSTDQTKIIVTASLADQRGNTTVAYAATAVSDGQFGDRFSSNAGTANGFATWPNLPAGFVATTSTNVYDNNNRVTSTTVSRPTFASIVTSTVYAGTSTTLTPPDGKAVSTTKVDAYGRTLETNVTDDVTGLPAVPGLANSGAFTTYAYSFDQTSATATSGRATVTITDDAGNISSALQTLPGGYANRRTPTRVRRGTRMTTTATCCRPPTTSSRC